MSFQENEGFGPSGEEEEQQALVLSYPVQEEENEIEALVESYVPEGYQVGDDHGRLVHIAHYNSQQVEAQLSGEEEEGSSAVRRYIPEGWEVGDNQGRLVHNRYYNSRKIDPKQE